MAVQPGDAVEPGQVVGSSGTTPTGTPAVCFEQRIDGKPVDPVQWAETVTSDLNFMTSRTRWIVLLISTPLVAFIIVGGLLGQAVAKEGSIKNLRIFEDVMTLILGNYVEEVKVDKVMDGAMRGLAEGLDAESAYLTPIEVKQLERNTAPAPGTTGLELTRQYYLRIISARDGSAGARAGIRTGDSVRAIDGQPTRNMSAFEGMRLLRGPVGSKVTLTVLRDNLADPHEVTLVREAEATGDVTGRIQSPGVGYIRVPAFATGATTRLKSQIAALARSGATRLVIDLRGTAQGPIDEGIRAARLFVPTGQIATLEARGQGNTIHRAEKGDGAVTTPIVLLSTAGTSGAAEIFAAALIDNKRATLIGERTLGRAGLQKLVKLPDGSGLWMTWARYLSPKGVVIHGTGLTPSIEVEEPDVEFGDMPKTDPILDKALEQVAQKAAA
jgi:carboxyl-terminal processing protease